MEQTNRLGTEDTKKLFFKMVIPAVIAQLITLIYNMVDRIFIGHIPEIGGLALTGIGICMPVMLIITSFSQLVGIGGTPRATMFMGQNKLEHAERTLGTCTFGLIFVSICLTILGFIFSEDILRLFGASENTLPYATDYLQTYICGTIFIQLTTGLVAFITAQGFTNISMKIVVTGAITNIILDPIFIFGLGMQTKGAALATILSQAISAIWALTFISGKKSTLKLRKKYIKLDTQLFLPCLALGLSPFIMIITECLISIAFNRSLLQYGGDMTVGTMTIFTTILQFITLPLQGFAQGAQPITSYNYGAKQLDRVSSNVKRLMKTSFLYSGSLCLIILLVPKVFIGIFTNDQALIDYSAQFIRIYLAMAGLTGIQLACQNSFLALGNAKVSIFLALLRKVFLLLPLIYLLPQLLSNQIVAVFLAQPIADLIAVTTTFLLFTREYKRKLSVKPATSTEETKSLCA